MANNINWGKIYGSTWWGNVSNAISWGKSYISLLSNIANNFKTRVLGLGGIVESEECIEESIDASLYLKPSGYSDGKVYTVLPEDGSGDMDFSRITSATNFDATRVEGDGDIQQVGENIPRLDYTDGGCPSLLLEPQSTNLVEYSEDFSQWSVVNLSIGVDSFASPNGDSNADKLIEDLSNSGKIIYETGLSYGTISIYARGDGSNRLLQLRRDGGSGSNSWAWFDVDNGVVISSNAGVASIEENNNGWYRCILTPTNADGTTVVGLSNNINETLRESTYQGDGTSGVYIWGAQLEALPYATSYIPTSGGIATRSAETLESGDISHLIGQTEGVFYVEMKGLVQEVPTGAVDGLRIISLAPYGSSWVNRISIIIKEDGRLVFEVKKDNVNEMQYISNTLDPLNYNKLAIKYKQNDLSVYANGVEIFEDFNVNLPQGLDSLLFAGFEIGTFPFYGHIKDLRIYKTALTDQELTDLTTI